MADDWLGFYDPIFKRAGDRYNVDPGLLRAVASQEGSNGNTGARSPAGAIGIMQMMPATAMEVGVDPTNPVQSIYGGAQYLRQLLDRFGIPERAIAAYNAGPGRESGVVSGSSQIPRETAAYVPGVVSKMKGAPVALDTSGPKLVPVDHDPFAPDAGQSPTLIQVDHDPFAGAAAPQPDYSTWDTAGPAPPPGMAPQDLPVPLKKEAGYYYGAVLPFRIKQDAAGNDIPGTQQVAVPEMIRAPIRGLVEGGQEARGLRPVNDPAARSDITAAASFGASPSVVAPIKSVTPAPTGALDPIYEFVSRIKGADISKDQAAMRIVNRMKQDVKGGGPTAQDMLDLLNLTPNKPLTISDVGGENVLGLVGKVARAPGSSKQTIAKFLDERDLGAGPRLDNDITETLGNEGSQDAFKALVKARSVAAKPLFEKAYEGGSIAPLERQFEVEFDRASAAEKEASQAVSDALTRLTSAQSKKPVTGGNVYAESAANDAVREATRGVQQARAQLTRAQETKEQILDMLRQSQADAETSAPGAVWNPRIQEFLDNPRIKQGIRRGMRIERDEALAEGRPINNSEYAIVGEDAEGEPVVGKVPTMRLLAVAKEGLDRMLQGDEFRSNLTGELNKEGVAIDKVRAEFLKELDAVNPDYAAARAQWGGDSRSLEAFQLGEKLFDTNPREIRTRVAEMTPNEKEFLRLGAARLLSDRVAKKGITGDEAKAILRDRYTRQQLRPMFDSDAAYDKFIHSVEAEGRMFGTRYSALRNSLTASRRVEDETPELEAFSHAARGILRAASQHWSSALGHTWEMIKAMGRSGDPEVNAAIANFATTDLSEANAAGRMRALRELLNNIGPQPTPKVEYGNIPEMVIRPGSAVLQGATNQQDQKQ